MDLKKWLTSSLRTKLVVMFVILTTMPLIFVGIISYVKSYQTISDHALDSAVLATEQLNRNIDIMFQDTIRFLEISKHEDTVRFLVHQGETYEDAKAILKAFTFYRETYNFSDSIIDINIVNTHGKAISEKRGVYQSIDPLQNNTFKNLMDQPDEIRFIPIHSYPLLNRTVISITSAIKRDITNEVIGFIVIDLDASVIESFLNHTPIGETGYFYLTDSTGDLLLTPKVINDNDMDSSFLKSRILSNQKGDFIDSSGSLEQFVVFNTSAQTGWKIIGKAPLKEILKNAYEIRSLIFISVAFSIIFTITLYYFISARLIRPIRNLKEKMRQAASGNFEVKVWNESTDEIADLGASFNIMLKKIKILLEKIVAEKELYKKAELRALQAQINPHFLYNTLDTIVWMAESKKSSQVIEITKALSHFFRITLSKGKDWITLRDEIEHTRNYLIIQKMRYRDILDVKIEINEEILQYKILKLTMQPLVENALYHGIKNKRGKGQIEIYGDFTKEKNIVLTIEDNGIGIKEQKLKEIMNDLNRTQIDKYNTINSITEGGFGLKNVHQRIQLHYGEPFGLSIHSEYGKSTKISLTIPAER